MAKNSPLAAAAYEKIKQKILSYSLQPNDAISDHQLASELGMSRAPVREAILQLIADGLIETSESGKQVVSAIGLQDIVDILHVRRALETEAIRIIAANGWLADAQEQELQGIHTRFCAAIAQYDLSGSYQFDDQFHTAIISYSRNERIKAIVGRMTLQMQRARWLNIAAPARQSESKEEHDTIFQALLARDVSLCVQCMLQHLSKSEKAFVEVFNDPNLKQVMSGIYSFYHQGHQ